MLPRAEENEHDNRKFSEPRVIPPGLTGLSSTSHKTNWLVSHYHSLHNRSAGIKDTQPETPVHSQKHCQKHSAKQNNSLQAHNRSAGIKDTQPRDIRPQKITVKNTLFRNIHQNKIIVSRLLSYPCRVLYLPRTRKSNLIHGTSCEPQNSKSGGGRKKIKIRSWIEYTKLHPPNRATCCQKSS